MAKYLSDLMAAYAAKQELRPARTGKNGLIVQEASVTVLAAHVDTEDYQVCLVPAEAIPVFIGINNTAITGGTDFDLGVKNLLSGSAYAFDKDSLFDGLSMASAANNRVINGAHLATDAGKTFWQLAGLAAAPTPGQELMIYLTGNTIGTADGTIFLSIAYNANV